MKRIMKRAIRDERGAGMLALVLVLLVVGGLVLTPLLGLMGTGLISGQVYEKKTEELYAADAGWEDAVWRIQTNTLNLTTNNWSDPWQLTVNGKNVTVQVHREDFDPTCGENITYQILSVATTPGTGSDTTVDSYVKFVPGIDLNILGGALVSRTDINLGKDSIINGDVIYCGTFTENGAGYTIYNGTVIEQCPVPFPTEGEDEELAQALMEEAMAGEIHYGDMVIPDHASANLGPTYITGNLTIGGNTTITLGGVLYVEGSIDWFGDCEHGEKHISFTGTGSIVAEGYICLGHLDYWGVTGDSVIMSLNGGITMEKDIESVTRLDALIYAPNGPVYLGKYFTVFGSVVGDSIVTLGGGSYYYVPIGGPDSWGRLLGGLDIETYNVT
jgi:hypothetical protein